MNTSFSSVINLKILENFIKQVLLMGDTNLLAKLSAGDLVAIEMKYHLKCLISLYSCAKIMESKEPESK